MARPAENLIDAQRDILTLMDMWERYKKRADSVDLGYPPQSTEQYAGSIGSTAPEPDYPIEERIDRIVEHELHSDLQRIVYSRYGIRMKLDRVELYKAAICKLNRVGEYYYWPSTMTDIRACLGLGRREYDGLLQFVYGQIAGKLSA